MAGNWSGAGTVTLDDGSTERIRCRASYAVGAGGNGLNQTLICASDSYKFNLSSNVIARARQHFPGPGAKAAETSTATIEGRGSNGDRERAGFTRTALTTRGNGSRRDQAEPVQGANIRCRATDRGRQPKLARSAIREPRRGFVHGLCDQQRLFLVSAKS